MSIVSRSAWGALPPVRPIPPVGHTHVEVHHGASSNAVADRDPARVLREYQRYHLSKGWRDLFYCLGLSPDGRLWEGRGIGRKSAGSALTVVLLGDYTNREPTDGQKAQILKLADLYGGRHRIDWHARRAAGTRYASSCPGAACIAWLRHIKTTPITPPITPAEVVDVHFIPEQSDSIEGSPAGRTAGWLARIGSDRLIPINGAPDVPIVGMIVAVNGTLVVTQTATDYPTYDLAGV